MAASSSDKVRKSYSFLQKSLSGGIGSGDTTIAFNNTTNIPTDTAIDFIIDRIDTNGNRTTGNVKELCKGVVSGSNVINVTRGLHGTTAQAHSSGAVVELVASGAAWNDFADAFINQHSQVDGSHTAVTATSLSVSGASSFTGAVTLPNGTVSTSKLTTELQKGWEDSYGGTTVPAPNTVTANGNRSYTCVFNGVDLSGYLSPGMRLRTTRTAPAPTQCTSLNGTTQYYSKSSPAGMTFTDDFVVSAWVKLASYPSGAGTIAARYNGTSGWYLDVLSTGQVRFTGLNGGAGNYRSVSSYQSLPLNKWVHVTAQLDMSASTATTTTMYIMIDGVDVPVALSQLGTNPTALIQAGDFQIGASNGTNFFPGKIAQVAIYSAKVTQATIKASMSQGLAGTETSLISAYSFSAGVITDLNTTNANNLTANGSAVATNADSPFGGQADGTISSTLDYGIIQSVSFSTNTTVVVQVPEGCTIPTSGGVSAVSYSTVKAPYGLPTQKGKWQIATTCLTLSSTTVTVNGTWVATPFGLGVPVGEWSLAYQGCLQGNTTGAASARSNFFTLQNTAPTNGVYNQESTLHIYQSPVSANGPIVPVNKVTQATAAAFTTFTLYTASDAITATETGALRGDNGPFVIYAENAYV